MGAEPFSSAGPAGPSLPPSASPVAAPGGHALPRQLSRRPGPVCRRGCSGADRAERSGPNPKPHPPLCRREAERRPLSCTRCSFSVRTSHRHGGLRSTRNSEKRNRRQDVSAAARPGAESGAGSSGSRLRFSSGRAVRQRCPGGSRRHSRTRRGGAERKGEPRCAAPRQPQEAPQPQVLRQSPASSLRTAAGPAPKRRDARRPPGPEEPGAMAAAVSGSRWGPRAGARAAC